MIRSSLILFHLIIYSTFGLNVGYFYTGNPKNMSSHYSDFKRSGLSIRSAGFRFVNSFVFIQADDCTTGDCGDDYLPFVSLVGKFKSNTFNVTSPMKGFDAYKCNHFELIKQINKVNCLMPEGKHFKNHFIKLPEEHIKGKYGYVSPHVLAYQLSTIGFNYDLYPFLVYKMKSTGFKVYGDNTKRLSPLDGLTLKKGKKIIFRIDDFNKAAGADFIRIAEDATSGNMRKRDLAADLGIHQLPWYYQIKASSIPVMSKPNMSSKELFRLYRYAIVRHIKQTGKGTNFNGVSGRWTLIEADNGKKGYVASSFMKELKM